MLTYSTAALVLALVAATCTAAAAELTFAEFKATNGKFYTAEQDATRAKVYSDNVAYFEQHNRRYPVLRVYVQMMVYACRVPLPQALRPPSRSCLRQLGENWCCKTQITAPST